MRRTSQRFLAQYMHLVWNWWVIFSAISFVFFALIYRSSSLSLSPAQQQREAVYFRTPPITRGKHKTSTLIDGCKLSGHVYKHLQEDESVDVESQRRWVQLFFSTLWVFSPGDVLFDSLSTEIWFFFFFPPDLWRTHYTHSENRLEWQTGNFMRN